MQVLLDFDLAEIYGYNTKTLNQQVKRNLKRFPEDFMFQLNQGEWETLRSQIVTSNNNELNGSLRGGRQYLPYAFTEQGIIHACHLLLDKLKLCKRLAFVPLDKFVLGKRVDKR